MARNAWNSWVTPDMMFPKKEEEIPIEQMSDEEVTKWAGLEIDIYWNMIDNFKTSQSAFKRNEKIYKARKELGKRNLEKVQKTS